MTEHSDISLAVSTVIAVALLVGAGLLLTLRDPEQQ